MNAVIRCSIRHSIMNYYLSYTILNYYIVVLWFPSEVIPLLKLLLHFTSMDAKVSYLQHVSGGLHHPAQVVIWVSFQNILVVLHVRSDVHQAVSLHKTTTQPSLVKQLLTMISLFVIFIDYYTPPRNVAKSSIDLNGPWTGPRRGTECVIVC